MKIFKLLLLVLLAHSALANASNSSATGVARSFYAWVIKHGGGGLPSRSALKAGESLMSKELLRLLLKAKVAENRCVATTPPDMKPLIFEGSLFVANYEGTTRVISMDAQVTDAGILISTQLEFKDPRWNVEAVKWPDQLTLIDENGKWVVGDIKGPASRKSLTIHLKDYIRANCAM